MSPRWKSLFCSISGDGTTRKVKRVLVAFEGMLVHRAKNVSMLFLHYIQSELKFQKALRSQVIFPTGHNHLFLYHISTGWPVTSH
jgi:hypothetical protein